ncbi:galactosyl transferase GMA12/MNN10 family-domain-containing protein [Calycina marina]|uniref:Galactosyl transferase GMA12/MNN10 family-domain-containing protein n=1 Tax=Calycina marina TaxID=1763456 RepID=A0A9P7Z9Q0_9HELO|nr:galactosyl transferase GMA12/MNN10 family-domain-containing protein [Calycina marina]
MHLALPKRKSSDASLYKPRTSRFPTIRRSRVQAGILSFCAIGFFFFIISRVFGGGDGIPSGTPPVVIVTVINTKAGYSKEYIADIKENRAEYARKRGYATFFPTDTDYDLNESPSSWARVPAMRHAMTKFPHSTFFWFLDQNALIMNPFLAVEDDIMNPKLLEDMMIKDQSVVPPDSVIKTFSHIKGNTVDLVLTQDKEGLAQTSFILRRGDWARFFLDTWFDPLYRSYNFQKADTHALEHIVQWHPTILSKLTLIPQRTINAYYMSSPAVDGGHYQAGDFLISFKGCEALLSSEKSCEVWAGPYSKQWRTIFNAR